MESNNRPTKKINKNQINKKKVINRDRVIKKRIKMLLSALTVGLSIGVVVGILLPIGGIKKSKYQALEKTNEKIQFELNNANKKIEELMSEVDENKIFTNLDKDKKEQVINYIIGLANGEEKNIMPVEEDTKATDIFNKIYKEYANSIGYGSFEDFNIVIDTFGYQYNITEEGDTKTVILKDEYAGDNVALYFEKTSDNQDVVLKSIRYNKSDKFTEINNTDYSNIEYIIYNGTKTKVNNINEQEQFLFSE